MSVTISISSAPDDIWMISNPGYRWLVARVAEFHGDQPDVAERLTVSGYLGGISLDNERRESPDLAGRIVSALLETVESIMNNDVPLADDSGERRPETGAQVYDLLESLRDLLNRFPVNTNP